MGQRSIKKEICYLNTRYVKLWFSLLVPLNNNSTAWKMFMNLVALLIGNFFNFNLSGKANHVCTNIKYWYYIYNFPPALFIFWEKICRYLLGTYCMECVSFPNHIFRTCCFWLLVYCVWLLGLFGCGYFGFPLDYLSTSSSLFERVKGPAYTQFGL